MRSPCSATSTQGRGASGGAVPPPNTKMASAVGTGSGGRALALFRFDVAYLSRSISDIRDQWLRRAKSGQRPFNRKLEDLRHVGAMNALIGNSLIPLVAAVEQDIPDEAAIRPLLMEISKALSGFRSASEQPQVVKRAALAVAVQHADRLRELAVSAGDPMAAVAASAQRQAHLTSLLPLLNGRDDEAIGHLLSSRHDPFKGLSPELNQWLDQVIEDGEGHSRSNLPRVVESLRAFGQDISQTVSKADGLTSHQIAERDRLALTVALIAEQSRFRHDRRSDELALIAETLATVESEDDLAIPLQRLEALAASNRQLDSDILTDLEPGPLRDLAIALMRLAADGGSIALVQDALVRAQSSYAAASPEALRWQADELEMLAGAVGDVERAELAAVEAFARGQNRITADYADLLSALDAKRANEAKPQRDQVVEAFAALHDLGNDMRSLAKDADEAVQSASRKASGSATLAADPSLDEVTVALQSAYQAIQEAEHLVDEAHHLDSDSRLSAALSGNFVSAALAYLRDAKASLASAQDHSDKLMVDATRPAVDSSHRLRVLEDSIRAQSQAHDAAVLLMASRGGEELESVRSLIAKASPSARRSAALAAHVAASELLPGPLDSGDVHAGAIRARELALELVASLQHEQDSAERKAMISQLIQARRQSLHAARLVSELPDLSARWQDLGRRAMEMASAYQAPLAMAETLTQPDARELLIRAQLLGQRLHDSVARPLVVSQVEHADDAAAPDPDIIRSIVALSGRQQALAGELERTLAHRDQLRLRLADELAAADGMGQHIFGDPASAQLLASQLEADQATAIAAGAWADFTDGADGEGASGISDLAQAQQLLQQALDEQSAALSEAGGAVPAWQSAQVARGMLELQHAMAPSVVAGMAGADGFDTVARLFNAVTSADSRVAAVVAAELRARSRLAAKANETTPQAMTALAHAAAATAPFQSPELLRDGDYRTHVAALEEAMRSVYAASVAGGTRVSDVVAALAGSTSSGSGVSGYSASADGPDPLVASGVVPSADGQGEWSILPERLQTAIRSAAVDRYSEEHQAEIRAYFQALSKEGDQ